MSLDYNIYLEVAAIPLDIILCIFLNLRYKKKSKSIIALKRFAVLVLIATTVDVATAIVTSAHGLVPNWIHYIFNTTDSLIASITGVFFIKYIRTYVRNNQFKKRYITTQVLLFINVLLLVTNPLTHLVFSYDENGNYIHEVLFVPVAYGFPILFFVLSLIHI